MKDPWLVVSIVRKGWGEAILDATMKEGAHGGTIVGGRGIGRNELHRVFGIQIESEKEVVLTIVPRELEDKMIAAIVEAGQLNAPGHGLAFSLPLSRIAGIVHLVEDPAAKPEADKKPADKDS